MATATRSIPLDADLLERAERVAKTRNMSVEAYLERLIRVVTEMQLDPESLPPLTRQALGLLSPMTDEEVAQALDEYRTKKYGGA